MSGLQGPPSSTADTTVVLLSFLFAGSDTVAHSNFFHETSLSFLRMLIATQRRLLTKPTETEPTKKNITEKHEQVNCFDQLKQMVGQPTTYHASKSLSAFHFWWTLFF